MVTRRIIESPLLGSSQEMVHLEHLSVFFGKKTPGVIEAKNATEETGFVVHQVFHT